jgi:RHS repeat-associated protein
LDGLGNWPGYVQKASGTATLNQTRTASPANEISGISASVGSTWATPAYDLAGNMTAIPIPTNLTSAYTAIYDAWNRLVSLTIGSTTAATYSYDGLNRRVVKGVYVSGSLDHNEHAYFNEKWQVLEVRKEVSGTINSNPLEQYVWHPFYIDAPILRDYDATTTGSPTRYYYTFDANYNVITLTGNTGSPAERYYYSPYGTLTFLGGSFNVLATQQSPSSNSVTYTGRQFDTESGLLYYRNRYMHCQLGVFNARDPIGYTKGQASSLYIYVEDNPLLSCDPYGLIPTHIYCNLCLTDCLNAAQNRADVAWANAFKDYLDCLCDTPGFGCYIQYQQAIKNALNAWEADNNMCNWLARICQSTGKWLGQWPPVF